ncbi:MAG: hypothetical protein ACKOD9_01315, partial [Rubrivivax sp.]
MGGDDGQPFWLAGFAQVVVVQGLEHVGHVTGDRQLHGHHPAGIAVTTSYNGKGVVDETSPVAAGMLGTWGSRSANRLLGKADVVIALGASLGPDYLRFRD